MSASATSEISTAKAGDASVSAGLDHAFAQLAGDPNGSAFGHEVTSAKAVTEQHVAAGNLPQVAINSGDLTQVG